MIERADVAQLDRVRPLWQGMQEHHARIAVRVGEIWPIRSASSSWVLRRESYTEWLGHPGAFLLIARLDGSDLGYLLRRATSGWTVLDTGPRTGCIESLAVHPDHRGTGVGGELMSRARSEFRAQGIETFVLSVFAENAGATHFYEEHGMTPTTVTYLGRIQNANDEQQEVRND